jgi:hypothetical protein
MQVCNGLALNAFKLLPAVRICRIEVTSLLRSAQQAVSHCRTCNRHVATKALLRSLVAMNRLTTMISTSSSPITVG